MAQLLEQDLWTAFVDFERRASRPERACVQATPENPRFFWTILGSLAMSATGRQPSLAALRQSCVNSDPRFHDH